MTDHRTVDPVRCAPWARAEAVDPIGSAGHLRSLLLVPWPLPWPPDAGKVPALEAVAAAARAAGARLQLVTPATDDDLSVVAYRSPGDDGWFGGFERHAARCDPADVADVALAVLAGEGEASDGRDVLVCTHGSRDRCCGSLGTALTVELALAPPPGVTVRRTSHLGGHRFAPTALLAREGTLWAYLDGDALQRIVARRGPVAPVLGQYRGSAGLASPAVQAVEREAFAAVGWSWFDHRRRGIEVDGWVELEAVAPDGARRAWRGRVEVRRELPVPACGEVIDERTKRAAELAVVELEER